MINIINNILSNNGYKLVDIDLLLESAEIYLFRPLDLSKREEYFVTARLNIQSDIAAVAVLEEIAQELFDKISCSGKVDISFEKNCTMLLCHEEGKINRNTILALEEDHFNFKKNVIVYSEKELLAIQAYLVAEQIDEITNSVINDIITSDNGKNFLNYKENHKHQCDHYSLILKISLKLPFVTYTPKEQELSNLDNDIESALTPDQLLIYKQLVNSKFELNEDIIHQQVEGIWGGLE